MSGQRDGLLDWGVEQRDALGQAQAVLLGVYAALDDVEKCEALSAHPFIAAQVNVALHEVQEFLERVPWVTAPPADSSPGEVAGKVAPSGEVQ